MALRLLGSGAPRRRTGAGHHGREDHPAQARGEGRAVCCYGFGIIAVWNKETQKLSRVFIDEIVAGSKAELIGLKYGDEILSLNGIKVADMKGGTKRGSDLFELLVDQPVGRMIDIEIAVRVVKKYVLTATY